MRKLVAGNWKMNGDLALVAEMSKLSAAGPDTDVMICPPYPLLGAAASAFSETPLILGAQDCHAAAKGAHTGDVSAPLLAEIGAKAVIVGHSERRSDHGESDEMVKAKVEAAWASDLTAILCIGETEAERLGEDTLAIIAAQLNASMPDGAHAENLVIAYEPIWAIGTGRIPTQDQIVETHDMLRAELVARFGPEGTQIRLLYGGSVNAENAKGIFAAQNVNGALVGGASLSAAKFQPIIDALSDA